MLKGFSVVLPSLDPDEKLQGVIDGLLAQGFTDQFAVNLTQSLNAPLKKCSKPKKTPRKCVF